MPDRAQFATPSAVRWLVTAAIALVVLAIVVDKALSAPALAAGEVEQVCGLCHVDWRRQFTALAIITGLVAVASWLLGGPKWPPEDDDE
jgi:membrane protein implicated in regulation of membrane protease activity